MESMQDSPNPAIMQSNLSATGRSQRAASGFDYPALETACFGQAENPEK